jgi:hypothetical protein
MHVKGIDTGSDKGLDPQVLFDRLEEVFNLSAVLVDGRDRGSAKSQVVGQEHERLWDSPDVKHQKIPLSGVLFWTSLPEGIYYVLMHVSCLTSYL